MSRVMAKKRRKAVKQQSKPRRFVPRPCTRCTVFRPQQANYSYVYHTSGKVRYCKCKFCDNTWTQTISADQITTGVVNRTDAEVVHRVVNRKHKQHGNNSIPPSSS